MDWKREGLTGVRQVEVVRPAARLRGTFRLPGDKGRLVADGTIDDSDVDAMWNAARDETEAAVAAADAAPIESVDTLLDHVTRPVEPTQVPRGPDSPDPAVPGDPGSGNHDDVDEVWP